MNNEVLKAAYLEILKDLPNRWLGAPDKRPGGARGLSGLFLPGVSTGYMAAKNKVMVVGCETAGWEPLRLNSADAGMPKGYKYLPYSGLEHYVDASMKVQQDYLYKKQAEKKNDKGRSFHNYLKKVANETAREGLIWANLFCFDWNKGSPINCPEFESIQALSKKLLDKQVEVLKPDFIIFASGVSSAKFRREVFPIDGPNKRCVSLPRSDEAIKTHHLWEFTLDKRIQCFRTHHPSARSPEAQAGLTQALNLLSKRLQK